MASTPEEEGLVRFLIKHCIIGIFAGWLALGAIFVLDLAGLWTLMTAGGLQVVPLALLAFGFAATFGSMAMGTAVFMLDEKSKPPSKPNAPELSGPDFGRLQAVRLEVAPRRR